jgi:hypothetical protein
MTGWSKYDGEEILVGVDFTPRLPVGGTLAATAPTVTIYGSGTLGAVFNSFDGNVVNVLLSGGVQGSSQLFRVTAFDSDGHALQALEQVDVLENAIETAAQEIQRRLTEARAQRHEAAMGNLVTEVWRNGRKVSKKVPSIKELDAYILRLECDLSGQTAIDGGRSRRRPIGLVWAN